MANTFKYIFGLYLTWHFSGLLFWANELFGNSGIIGDATLNPTYKLFPNILNIMNPTYLIFGLIILSLTFTFGYYSRVSAFLLWYGWACLLNRNILITNPGMAYVGWLLLVMAFCVDNHVTYNVSWFLMAIGYTISGLHKLDCPSWIDGSALYHVLNSPLARDNFIRNFLLNSPEILLKFATWFSLVFEISFLPLGCFYNTRFYYWFLSLGFHVGIMSVINFTDLTLGVLMIHFFVFDEKWIKSFLNYMPNGESIMNIFFKV